MKRWSIALVLIGLPTAVTAAEVPTYAKQVRPFLVRYCLECHNAKEPEAHLNLESVRAMLAGGAHGAALVPGNADASAVVRRVEGKAKPAMPPKKARQPTAAEVALLRAWVDAGAKDEGAAAAVVLPAITPRRSHPAPIAALAYRLDGKVLAVGGHGEVLLLDVATGDITSRLAGQQDEVSALGFSAQGLCAVASGAVGTAGTVRIYGDLAAAQLQTLAAHGDAVLDLAFSPDGTRLATCGYDRLVRLWDVATGKLLQTLRDHSDAVYGVAFSPDGQRLASVAADRAVKVWDVATGRRLFTLSEATDWLYTVAWSPDGDHLAAAGVDKSIRSWLITKQAGQLDQSVFAHEGAVTRIVYSADGKTLFSLGEDRLVKVWDAGRLVERMVFPHYPEAALSLALRPDGKQVAVGRYDGVLALQDATSGKQQLEPLPIKPKPPTLEKLVPAALPRGAVTRVHLHGKNLTGVRAILVAGIKTTLVEAAGPNEIAADFEPPAGASLGVVQVAVETAAGRSAALPLNVDAFPNVAELKQPHTSPKTGQMLNLSATVTGTLAQPGQTDWYRFEARAGQEVGALAVAAKGEPILQLVSESGAIIADSANGLLGYTCPNAGVYALGVRDREYRGEPAMTYRLHVGALPVATGVYPLGLQRGTTLPARLEGVNLGHDRVVKVTAPATAAAGTKLPVVRTDNAMPVLGNPTLVVGMHPETIGEGTLIVPGTANEIIAAPAMTRTWTFAAKKGQHLLLEVEARRLGSPLDSTLEILDAQGHLLPRAVLRATAKTYVTFRDHDAASRGIRLETWNDFAMRDYVLGGNELMRIRELPKGPDDDCLFYSETGDRLAFQGTTPVHHPLGEPFYKVGIFPPGTTFPANGLPTATLYQRNDDGGPAYGKDSFLDFVPPADGIYQARVSDSRGQGGPLHAFRLTVRPPVPDFSVTFVPNAPAVAPGAAVAIGINVTRRDGFEGPISLRFDGLPAGLQAPAALVGAGETSTVIAIAAAAGVKLPANSPPLKLIATAEVEGKELRREALGTVPRIEEMGDIQTTVETASVHLHPGEQTRLQVRVERRRGHTGRIPVEVRGLPYGVRVLDIGLNGILITERETSRQITLYAEPWVAPVVQPIVLVARSERKNSEHAAPAIELQVTPKK